MGKARCMLVKRDTLTHEQIQRFRMEQDKTISVYHKRPVIDKQDDIIGHRRNETTC